MSEDADRCFFLLLRTGLEQIFFVPPQLRPTDEEGSTASRV
jgi:hypothetical protein